MVLAPHLSALFSYKLAPFLARLPQMLVRNSRTTQNYNNCHGEKTLLCCSCYCSTDMSHKILGSIFIISDGPGVELCPPWAPR